LDPKNIIQSFPDTDPSRRIPISTNLALVDCSKTIWILATNAVDDTILSFCAEHRDITFNDDRESEKLYLIVQWSKQIKGEFLDILDVSVLASITIAYMGTVV
jgi:hypothetical protein